MSEKVNGSYLTREGALTRDASFNVYCSITACRQYEKKKNGDYNDTWSTCNNDIQKEAHNDAWFVQIFFVRLFFDNFA